MALGAVFIQTVTKLNIHKTMKNPAKKIEDSIITIIKDKIWPIIQIIGMLTVVIFLILWFVYQSFFAPNPKPLPKLDVESIEQLPEGFREEYYREYNQQGEFDGGAGYGDPR